MKISKLIEELEKLDKNKDAVLCIDGLQYEIESVEDTDEGVEILAE